MFDSKWYQQLIVDDYAYDVSEEVMLAGEYPIYFMNKKTVLQVEFIQAVANENEIELLKEPSIQQQQIWEHYIQHHEHIHSQVLQAIFDFYQQIEDRYRQAWEIDLQDPHALIERDQSIPYVQQASQLKEYVTLQAFLIGDSPVEGTYYLNFHCTWDTEHGLGVKMVDHQPVHIGSFVTSYDIDL